MIEFSWTLRDVLAALGLASIVLAAFMWAPIAGFVVLGVSLITLAVMMSLVVERSGDS